MNRATARIAAFAPLTGPPMSDKAKYLYGVLRARQEQRSPGRTIFQLRQEADAEPSSDFTGAAPYENKS